MRRMKAGEAVGTRVRDKRTRHTGYIVAVNKAP